MPKITLHIKKRIFNDIYYPHLFDYSNRYDVYFGGSVLAQGNQYL